MAWQESTVEERRAAFLALALAEGANVSALCRAFGVSRKTGHKWLTRYRQEGAAGLHERSRRPHGCAHQTAARIERLILRERRRHRTWWPKKLRRLLRRDHGIRRPPACSTIAAILGRANWVRIEPTGSGVGAWGFLRRFFLSGWRHLRQL